MPQSTDSKNNSTLVHSFNLQTTAAKYGFDWATPMPILEKLVEETAEFIEAATEQNAYNMQDEFGDLLFTLINIGRAFNINPEHALQHANQKFDSRFAMMQTLAIQNGQNFVEMSLEVKEKLWVEAKILLQKRTTYNQFQ